jgi:hypothetical protein
MGTSKPEKKIQSSEILSVIIGENGKKVNKSGKSI